MVDLLIESLVTKVTFYPCKLATPYNLKGTFSNVNLTIEECQDGDGKLMAIALVNVFDIEKDNIEYFLANILPTIINDKDIPGTEKAMFWKNSSDKMFHAFFSISKILSRDMDINWPSL